MHTMNTDHTRYTGYTRHTTRVDVTPATTPAVAPRHHRVLVRVALAAFLAIPAAPSLARAQPRVLTQLSLEPRRSFVLTEPELRPNDTRSLLDVVASRWPGLAAGEPSRGAPRVAAPWGLVGPSESFGVYDIFGTYLGGPDYLESLFTSNVTEVRRLTELEEYAAFGRRHPAGAIVVTWAHRYRR
jgi:hypothetical protein